MSQCGACHVPALESKKMLRCSGCKSVNYCNEACQQQAWGGHQESCRRARGEVRRAQATARKAKQKQVDREYIDSLTPEEFKWKSWLGAHGHGTVVTSENIHRYDPNFQPQPPQPPPAAVISPTTTPIAPNLTASAHTAATRSGCQNASNQGKVGGEHVGEQVAYGPALHWDREPIRFGLGAKYAAYSWRQTTTEVEVRIKLPSVQLVGAPARSSPAEHVPTSKASPLKQKVKVALTPFTMEVTLGESVLLSGALQARAYIGGNCDDRTSTWYVIDGVVVIHLVKWLRQSIGPCTSAASTWWPMLLQDGKEAPFSTKYPPNDYYDTKLKD